MWGTLIMGALSTALSPVRLAIVVLLSSRPRPLRQLFAYWLGALILGTSSLLIPLLALHATPAMEPCTRGPACGSNAGYLRIGLGLLAISIAALILARSARSRRTGPSPATVGDGSRPQLTGDTSNPVSRLLSRDDDSGKRSVRRRLLNRIRDAWEDGSVWVAALIGALIGGPSADGVILGLAIIASSGAPISTQIVAAIVLVLLMLAVVEVILVGAIVVPAKMATALERFHDVVRDHRTKILVVVFTLLGIAWLAQGASSI